MAACLQVGPGEVDDELEMEVGLECQAKYGTVVGVNIFEVTTPGWCAVLPVARQCCRLCRLRVCLTLALLDKQQGL